MPRIRTIKPEFPQSESMGNVTRDARLLFIQLWTLADDSGRLRGASRMLASLLYPYDDDAPELIDEWLEELDREECIVRYKHETQTYIQICNWFLHQKIDKPSQSKVPPFDESSRILANPRERSSGDQGPKDLRTKDQGRDQGPKDNTTAPFVAEVPEPSKAIVAKPKQSALYHAIRQCFLAKTPTFANYAKEAQAIKRIEAFAGRYSPDDREGATLALIEKYWELVQSQDKFWHKQPFTPAGLSSLMDRVARELEINRPQTQAEYEESYAAAREVPF